MNLESKYRPRRSCLYMPGSNARALEKARGLAADVLLLDLEDAVAPALKSEARERVCTLLQERPYEGREVVIRVNALASPWGVEDIRAVVAAGADALLAPKVESAAQLRELDHVLDECGADRSVALWVMVETPLSVANVCEIAATASTTRLTTLVLGSNDLAKDMRVSPTPDRQCFWYALSSLVTAARAYGLVAIDGVFNAIDDPQGLRQECLQGYRFGFDGKSLIHPAQLATANSVFAPSSESIAEARDIVAAFASRDNDQAGVITVNGKMVERLHLQEARRLLAIQDAIGSQALPPDS